MSNTVHRPSQSYMEWINVKDRKTGKVVKKKNTAYRAPFQKASPSTSPLRKTAETREAPGTIDNITDPAMIGLLANVGGGDAKAGWDAKTDDLNADFIEVFGDDAMYNAPSTYDYRTALDLDDPIQHVAAEVIDELDRANTFKGGAPLTGQQRKDMATELVASGFFKSTMFGQVVEKADGIAKPEGIRAYAEDNGLIVSATPDKDYMGSPSWSGSRAQGFDEKAKVEEIKGHLKALRTSGELTGRTSVRGAKYSSRTVTVKHPGFEDLSRSEQRIIENRVGRNLLPVTSAFDYDQGNIQYDYFNSIRTTTRVTG